MTTHPTPTLLNTPPPFVVRVTALPTSALQVTRSPGTSAALGRAREHQDQLAHDVRQLDLALHRQVGEATDQEQRRLLLRLKRRTAEKGWSAETLQRLGELAADLAPQADRHAVSLRQYHTLLGEGEGLFERETAEAAAAVREWSMNALIRAALLLSSPTLLADAERFWHAEPMSGKTRRQVLTSLTRYLVRAATKPTPFNRFTSMSAGEWRTGAALLDFNETWTAQVRQELNLQVRGALTSAPGRQDIPEPALEIHLNPTLITSPAQHVVLAVKGPVVRVRRNDRMDALIGAMRGGPLTFAALQQRLDPHPTPEDLWRDLQRLQGAGLLELLPPAGWQSGWLQDLDAVFSDFVNSLPDHRPGQMQHLRAQTQVTYTALDLGRLGWTPPERNLVFEDSGAGDLRPVACADAWRPILDDLLLVQQAYSLAEGTLGNRLQFARWFCRRYGPGAQVPAVQVYQDVLVDGRPWAAEQRSFAWMSEAPAHLADGIRQVRRLLGGDGQGVIDRQALTACLGELPADLFSPSYAFYGQLLGGPAPSFVLNAVQLGFGRTQGRARWIMDARPGEVRTGRPLLDLTGEFHANINRHACARSRAVVLNGRATGDGDLSVLDLHLSVPSPTARPVLWSAALDRPVWGVPLGMLGARYLPPFYRFLTAMTVGGPLDPALPLLTSPPQDGAPSPRLQLGQVVLQRARWSVPGERLAKLTATADFRSALAVASAPWLQDLPTHVFLRQAQEGGFGKPVFADLASPLSWATLPRPTQGSVWCAEEALPDPLSPAAWGGQVQSVDGTHVTEFVVEPRYA